MSPTGELRPENAEITLPGDDVIEVLREIELILISLHKMGSYYYAHPDAGVDVDEYRRETTRFIDERRVTRRLARARRILSEAFDSTLGDDDMDDLERAMQGIDYWTPPTA